METILREKPAFNPISWLPAIALGVDLFTPYLIWKNIIPAEVRWLSHLAIALMIGVTLVRMLGFNRIPPMTWTIMAVTILWAYIAIGNGQGIVPTIWGVWLLFQFPFAAFFIYLQPEIPHRLPDHLRTFCLIVLAVEVAFQILQFASGVKPGDDLSGLFGKNGTGNLVLFNILVCCVFLGHWLASKQWSGLLTALSLGMLSSALGEMKIFAAAIAVIGLVAVFMFALKYRAPGKMLLSLTLIFLTLVGFVSLYNTVVPGAANSPLQTFIATPGKLMAYLNQTRRFNRDGVIYSDIGRLDAVRIGWSSITKDPLTLLFGYGIGTRSESQTLGTAGVALTTGGLGISVGTSLLVMMQEMGMLGLALLAGCWGWLLIALLRDIRADARSPATGLRYALFLFSLFWPLWLWYATTWTSRVPMLLYWISLGYAFAESSLMRRQKLSHVKQA